MYLMDARRCGCHTMPRHMIKGYERLTHRAKIEGAWVFKPQMTRRSTPEQACSKVACRAE
jgi:hypothetical protein